MSINRVENGEHPDYSTQAGPRIRAAEYLRMSTEHQKYSIQNQSAAIRRYAALRGMEIVRTYSDLGRSGLNLIGRPGLQQLLADVRSGSVDYSVVLVYDISRWGRFQDSDEPAAYEYACRVMGVRVAYCAERFENDGSIGSDIQKLAKRHMAAEYSRDLSAKIFAGQCRLIELGYRQGGAAGFGLRRHLVDENGVSKGELAPRQWKSIHTDRVVLVPGPPEERAIVQEIYNDFVYKRLSKADIAARLNERGVLSDLGRRWTRISIHQILTNEKYIGNNIWNRGSSKLAQPWVLNPRDLWVRADGAFQGIVDRPLFDEAQEIMRARSNGASEEDLLQRLRFILASNGRLSRFVIDHDPQRISARTIERRFGSLRRAYELIGYPCDRNCRHVETYRCLRRVHSEVTAQVSAGVERVGGKVIQSSPDLLLVNEEFSVSVIVIPCRERRPNFLEWVSQVRHNHLSDVTIAVRMNRANNAARDYLIIPTKDMDRDVMRLTEHNGIALDACLSDSLDHLFEMARRVPLDELT